MAVIAEAMPPAEVPVTTRIWMRWLGTSSGVAALAFSQVSRASNR